MRGTLFGTMGRSAMAALLFVSIAAPAASALAPQDPEAAPAPDAVVPFTPDQLDNLVAPVALYPDPLLAQVFLAATFPDQVAAAAQYVRANGTVGIDDQYWDVSVKAVAHYPTVLNMMDQRIDWTTTMGQAYAQQSSDVMQAVQHMRQLARAEGNLESTPQQQVVVDAGYLRVWPAQPQVIYVPVYDPAVVYCRPVYRRAGWHAYFSFGVGYPIGAWLIYDWDWPARRIVYTGWYGDGWIARSRPYISITSIYVNAGYRRPYYDHDVIYRRPDYRHIRVYDGLGSRRADYDDHMRGHGSWNDGGYDHNAGRYAVPRDGGHGVVTAGGGYREPRQVQTGAHVRVMPQNDPPARRMPASSAPAWPGRTVEPRRAAPAPAPDINWGRERVRPAPQAPERVQPQVEVRPSRVEPRGESRRAAPPPREQQHQPQPRSAHERRGHGRG